MVMSNVNNFNAVTDLEFEISVGNKTTNLQAFRNRLNSTRDLRFEISREYQHALIVSCVIITGNVISIVFDH